MVFALFETYIPHFATTGFGDLSTGKLDAVPAMSRACDSDTGGRGAVAPGRCREYRAGYAWLGLMTIKTAVSYFDHASCRCKAMRHYGL